MKIWLSLLFGFWLNLIISQEDKQLLFKIIEVRENHLFNQKKEIIWQEYNHTTISSNFEKINKTIDTIWQSYKNNPFKIDSSSYKLKQFNSSKHFYQAERNIRHERKNNRHRQIITKYKMAGFREPIYESLALELYSKTIFDDDFYFFHTEEVHPLSKKGLKTYDFTISEKRQDEYLVSFKQKHKEPIYGSFIIDKKTLQIKEAEIKKMTLINISVNYQNTYDEHLKTFLPKGTTFIIEKGIRETDLKIFGKFIYFKANREKGFFSDEVYLKSISNYSNFIIKPIKSDKKDYITLNFELRDEDSFMRNDSLFKIDYRNESTYQYLDSISSKNKIEKRINIARKIYDGFYPLNQFDINLKRLINYNNYEGFRLGLGLQTNKKFSKKFQSSGHIGYGLQDRKTKYYFKQAMRIGNFSDSWLSVAYQDDIREIGSTAFQTDQDKFIYLNLRPLNLTTFYSDRHVKGEFTTKILPKTHTIASLSYAKIDPLFDYRFLNKAKIFETYNITSVILSMQWEPWSEFMQTPDEKIVYKNGYPKFTFQFTQSLSGYTNNDFNFQKFDFKTTYKKTFWNKHVLKYFLQSGIILGSTPLTHVYSVFPNSANRPEILQRFDFSGINTFETMRRNEFFSDRFIFNELIYEIPFQFGKSFDPVVSLVSRYGIGNLSDKETHLGVEFSTMEKGYWETGVEFFNLYNWFGLSFFYRHGAYGLPNFQENVSLKLNFRIVI